MKSLGKALLLAGAVSFVFAAGASAMVTVTKHNFSDGAASGDNKRSVYLQQTGAAGPANGEVCVFCHSPHVGEQVANAPLWNRAVTTSSYTPYMSSTIDAPGVNGTDTAGRQPKGVSLACLSCHDGTIAIDALRNAPGSGNFQSNPTSRGWQWVGLDNSNNTLPEDGRITNLTTNLSGQHPISIEYPYYNGVNGQSADWDPKFFAPNKWNSSGLAWFDYGTRTDKPDDNEVRMYKTNPSSNKIYVECASCHNPHGTEVSGSTFTDGSATGNAGPDGINYPTFLRRSNNQSALCTTCHIK